MIGHCFSDPDVAIGAWVLGILHPRDLPSVATAFLANGIDGGYLRELAGSLPIDQTDNNVLFESAIHELGWTIPDRPSAAAVYARCVSKLILNGEVTPYDGAEALWDASLAVGDKSFHDLDTFIYAASEYRGRPQDRAMFDDAIVEEAKRWTHQHRAGRQPRS